MIMLQANWSIQVTQRQSVTLSPHTSIRTSIKPVTSQQKVTVSGAVETRYITSTPSETAQASGSTADFHEARSGLSNGAVAGITIGVIAAAAIAALFLFCCWRRRKSDKESGGINRNTSVLSKAGLLRNASTGGSPPTRPASAYISNTAPRLDTQIPSIGISGPPSAAASGMLERSDSKPLFRDQRLNPNALMLHSDISRTSVGTLQDDKDYSRPLEVSQGEWLMCNNANTSIRSATRILHDNDMPIMIFRFAAYTLMLWKQGR